MSYNVKQSQLKLFIPCILFAILLSCANKATDNKQQPNSGLRIVSLAPSITKELVYLGVEDQIVGLTSYCDIAATNQDKIIGNALDINIERILLLKPDIVFATGLSKADNIETLKNNGLKVYTTGKMCNFNELCQEFIAIGKLVSRENTARAIIENSKAAIDSLQTLIPTSDSLSLFFQIGAKPLFGVIPNTFMDDLIHFAKCKNVAFDMNHGTLSRETILNRNPDVIYVATMGIMGAEEKKVWEGYNVLNAVKNKRVFIIDSNMACTPSVVGFTETLRQMLQEIYGIE